MNIDSPFEQWRLKYMQGTAVSREIMELLALAIEGGRVAERESCAALCDELKWDGSPFDCAEQIRSRK